MSSSSLSAGVALISSFSSFRIASLEHTGTSSGSTSALRGFRTSSGAATIAILTLLLLLIPAVRQASADDPPATTSTDPFDVTQGTTIISSDVAWSPTGAFRTTAVAGEFEGSNTLMRIGGLSGQGAMSFIEFRTGSVVTIRGVRLFASNDGAFYSFARAMSRFRLWADTDASGEFETLVVDTAINVNYALQPGNLATNANHLNLTLLTSGPVTSQRWRLETTQGTHQWTDDAVRLIEVDALAAAPVTQGTTTRVSVSSGGTEANGPSQSGSISADGRFVAFTSWATNLVTGDTNGRWDVFVHDRLTATTERVSVSSAQGQADGNSFRAAISADGRFVAFISLASNLVDGDTNGRCDVFVRDRDMGTTERVSVSSEEVQGNGHSVPEGLAITPDGRYVAFASNANNHVPGDTIGMDVFVRDRMAGTTERVSVTSAGVQGNSSSSYPAISADGRFVAFASWSSNLDPDGDTNGLPDVFIRDRQTATTSCLGLPFSGGHSNHQSWLPGMSADGLSVAFGSFASNLVEGDTNGIFDFFLHDRRTRITELISVSSAGAQSNNPDSASAVPSLSADGRFVAFVLGASNLVEGDTNGTLDIFVRDRMPQIEPSRTDLAIEANASPDPVQPGGQVTYVVTLINRGPDAAPVDTIVLITPPSTIAGWADPVFVGSTHPDGSVNASITGVSCTLAAPALNLTCRFTGADPALIPQGRHAFRLVATVSATAVSGPLTSTVQVTSSVTEQSPGDETRTATVQVFVPLPAIPPAVQITRPATTLTTLASAVTLRGSASDDDTVQRVGWIDDHGGSGTATGTSFGNPSWIARKLPLAEGTNRFTVTAYDNEGLASAPAEIEVVRIAETAAVASLAIDGIAVVSDGQLLVEQPTLAGGEIQIEIDGRLLVTTLHILLNGEALATSRGEGNVFTATVDVSRLPKNLPPAPVAYQLSAVVELADGTSVVLPVVSGALTLRSIPLRVDSVVEPIATENEGLQSRWTTLAALSAGPIQDFAVDSTGAVWAVTGGPIVTTIVDTTEVAGTEIRYVTQIVGSSADNALWHWDGATWRRVTAADLGLAPALFTAVAIDGATLWIGTDRGLAEAQLSGGFPPSITSFQTAENGMAGSWISSLRVEPDRLLVAHKGSRFYRLHTAAVKRYWIDGGGVSVRTAGGWTAYRSERLDDGSWQGVAGFDVMAVAPAGGTGYWAASELGLTRFDGAFTYHNRSTGLPMDTVVALDAAGPDEVWAGGASGAASLQNGAWTALVAGPNGLPSTDVRDIRIDGRGHAFFSTSSGVASINPTSRLWTVHRDGDAGALAVDETGRVHTAVNATSQTIVSAFDGALSVTLDSPADGARFATDESGLATVTLGWTALPMAEGYEVFLGGALIGRTTSTSHAVKLRAGDFTWTVRAVVSGNAAGLKSVPRSLRVGESRERGDAEFLLIYRTADGTPRVVDVFREPATTSWQTFTVDPRFRATDTEYMDLAAAADGRMVSAPSIGGWAVLEQYPDPLTLPVLPAALEPRRVDVTSEPGGSITQASGTSFILYDRIYGASPEITTPPGLSDFAGLANGRVAALDGGTVRIFERREAGGAIAPVQNLVLGETFNAFRIAPLPDGGFAVLGLPVDQPNSRVIRTYDASLSPRSSIRFNGVANDLAADEEGRIFVLVPGPVVYMTRDVGESPTWTAVPISLPSGGSDAAAIATYFTPAPRPARVSTPDAPPGPPPGGTVTLPGSDVFVYQADGFSGCQDNSASTWILGFLRTDTLLACDATTLSGIGLYLDYRAEAYGPVPAGAPSNATAMEIVRGPFTLNLTTGAITGAQVLSVPGLGPVTAERLGVLGMGEYRNATQRKGIGVSAGSGVNTFGGLTLEFSHLVLTDVGGTFHQTFGGIDGLLAPYDEGSFGFAGVPLRFRTTGDLRTPTSCALGFDPVRTEVLSSVGGTVLFPLELVGLCINPDAVTFGESTSLFGLVLGVTIHGGAITATGVSAAEASLAIGSRTLSVTNVHAGVDGFWFESAPGGSPQLYLAGIGVTLGGTDPCSVPGCRRVQLILPGEGQPGSFSAGFAQLAVSQLSAHLDQLKVPFDFFRLPPAAFPTAQGGGLEISPVFKADIAPGLQIGADSITIPQVSLAVTLEDKCDEEHDPNCEPDQVTFETDFAGGQFTKDFVELFDPDPVTLFGASFDFERVRLGQLESGGTGFFTSRADVSFPPVTVTLRDFSINNRGAIGISGGGFRKAGFAFDIARRDCTDVNNLCFVGSFSLAPVINNARGDVTIANGALRLNNFTFDAVNLGPLRVKDPLFDMTGEEIFIGATVGFGRFPDVSGWLRLNDGALQDLGLRAQFTVPGYPLYGPLFLQRVEGHLNLADGKFGELGANVLLSGGPQLKFAPFVPNPIYLVTLEGAVTVSGLGYFETTAQLRLLGFPMAQARAIVGNVYLNGQFVGVGMYFNGSVLLFGGILDVGLTAWVYPPLGGVLAPGPQQGTYGGDLRGTLKVPSYVPLIGGLTFGQANVALRGNFGPPASAVFSGHVSIPLCTPPIYYCTGIRWCRSWIFRYPCGLTGCGWHYACWDLDVGFRIDDSGFHASSLSALASDGVGDTPGFNQGYRQQNGLTVLTNFKLGGSATPLPVSRSFATATAESMLQSVATFNVPEGIPQAIIRIDFSNLTGDADLSLRLPDGRIFTKDNTPRFTGDTGETPPSPGDMFIFYRHQLHDADANDPADRPLKEAAFFFRGPFEFRSVALTDSEGNPTGQVGEYFSPANVPAGAYEVTVESTGDAGQATVELLLGNQPPRLTGATFTPLGSDRYRLDWAADDPEGDPVTIRLHLGTNLDTPEFSQQLGDQNGYTVPGGSTFFEFDLRAREFLEQHITSPLHLFVSLEDGFSEREYIHVATLDPPVSEKAPPQVTGVVVHPRENGSALEVYWDHVSWTPPTANLALSRYGVVVQEIGPAGTLGPALTTTVSLSNGNGIPIATEAVVNGLMGGRRYRVTVSAVAQETIAGGGAPVCPCSPPSPPEPGDTCFDPPVACDTPTDLIVEHAGPTSAPIVFTAPTGAVNSPPRFLSAPAPVARLGEAYASPIRTEDPDGDAVNVQLCGCRPLASDPAKTSCDPPIAACDPPSLPGLQIAGEGDSRVLSYAPAEAGVGRHHNALVARDGNGGEAVQQFNLEVVHFAPPIEHAVFTSEPPGSVALGETFVYRIEVTGLSSNVVPRFTLAAGPQGMTVAATEGLVTWVPDPEDLGKHTVTLQVVDTDPGCSSNCSGDSLGTQTFILEVVANKLGDLGPVLSVTPATRSIGPDSGLVEFAIANSGTGSLSWTATVEPGSGWLTIMNGGTGEGAGVVRVQVAGNDSGTPRTGTLRIDAAGNAFGSPRRVTVEQEAARLAFITVTPATVVTHDRRAGRFEIAIRNTGAGTLEWSAVVLSGTQWLGLEGGFAENNGAGDGVIAVTYKANPTGPSRSGVIRILSRTARNSPVDIDVSQFFELFTEHAATAGLDTPGAKEGGLIFCDFNDDRWPDALVNVRPDVENGRSHLYFNNGEGGFVDVTATHAAGLLARPAPRSAICGDLNNDGWTDFARNSSGHVEIYLNRGPQAVPPWTFGAVEQQPNQVIQLLHGPDRGDEVLLDPLGLQAEGIAFIDHDNDGDLDLAVDDDLGGMWIFPNDGRGTFGNAARHGLSGGREAGGYIAVADYDLDGDVDLLARREGQRNLWTNTGVAGFQINRSLTALRSTEESGVAFCDVDRDGDFDVLWGDPAGAEIWRNQSGVFAATGEPAGSARVSFAGQKVSGVACGDVDNDGDLDVFLATSSGTGIMFLNDTPIGAAGVLVFHRDNSGIDLKGDGRGIVFSDVDRDGDLDLVANINGAPNQVWKNHRDESGATDYLAVRAVRCLATGVARDEIGATVRLFESDGVTPAGPAQEVSGGAGLGSQGASVVHFGLPNGADRSYVVEVRFLTPLPQEGGSQSGPRVLRRAVVPSALGARQLLEVYSCRP